MKILFSQKQIQDKVKELAGKIKKGLGKKITCIVVLTGTMVFFGDLLRELHAAGAEVRFFPMKVSSYKGKESTGKITLELDADVKGKVLIVEDIIDTGLTLAFLKKHFEKKGCKVKTVAFLDKREARIEKIDADYTGFVIPNAYVIGYGLDYNERYRDLPYIGILK